MPELGAIASAARHPRYVTPSSRTAKGLVRSAVVISSARAWHAFRSITYAGMALLRLHFHGRNQYARLKVGYTWRDLRLSVAYGYSNH